MKRVLLIILSFLIVSSLVGCQRPDSIEKDENGRVIRQTVYRDNGKILYIHVYEYGDNGKDQILTEYDGNNNFSFRQKYEYREDLLYKSSRLDINYNIEYYVIFDYYSDGNKKRETEYDGITNQLSEISDYNENGQIVKSTKYNDKGLIDKVEEYEYNSSRKLTRYIEYDGSGNIITDKAY